MRSTVFFSLLCAMLVVSACANVTNVESGISSADQVSLAAAVAARDADKKARDGHRRPFETLAFIGIESDMAVAEVLPGGGWYTEILAPYLAQEGAIMGLNYSDETWPMFGFFSAERIAETIARNKAFPAKAQELAGGNITASSTTFGQVAQEDYGTLDAVLFIRALHNLHRFEAQGGTLSQAVNDTKNLLKTGGIVGVVQHWAPELASDDWADGSNGYLKESRLTEVFVDAGFELVGRSLHNANPNDRPTPEDSVWRLPPNLRVGDLEGAAKEAAIEKNTAIGESNRIVLKFVKR